MLHYKATALNTGERLESAIEHQRKRRLRRIEARKRALNRNTTSAQQIVGKIARQVDARGAQRRNGIQGKAGSGLGRKFLDRMAGTDGNNTGGRTAQRRNMCRVVAGTTQVASERTDLGALAHRKRHGPNASVALTAHGNQVGGVHLDWTRGQ